MKKTNIKKEPKKMPFKRIDMSVFTFVILIFTVLILLSSVFMLIIRNIKMENPDNSRLIFIISECFLMFFFIALPTITNRVIKIKIPPIMEIIFVTFCALSVILGDIFDFYGIFGWWDSFLHSFSGALFGILGYVILNTFNKYDNNTDELKFSPIFVSLWVVCFALAMGAIWEIGEYLTDGWFGNNAQQYMESRSTLATGEPLVGRAALADTMKDLMLDLAGSLFVSIIGFFELRRQKKGFTSLALEKDEELIERIDELKKKRKIKKEINDNNKEDE